MEYYLVSNIRELNMDQQVLLEAKAQGYTAIDITTGNIVFTHVDDQYQDYGFIVTDGITIYDRYGITIKKYSFRKNFRITDSFIIENYIREHTDTEMYIYIPDNIKFYPLMRLLTEDIYSIIINCNDIYIPAYCFENIIATKLSLLYPILDFNIIQVINCHEVHIRSYDQFVSFEWLNCRVFSLEYSYEQVNIPVVPTIPYNAVNVSISIIGMFGHNVVFNGTNNIETFTISCDDVVQLDNFPSLVSLSTGNTIMSIDTLMQLRELVLLHDTYNFNVRGNDVHITPGNVQLFNLMLPNMEVFEGRLSNDWQYSLMSNLRKLTTDTFIDPQYIPPRLEEYRCGEHITISHNYNDVVTFIQALLAMPSIQRMPLVIHPIVALNLPFEQRFDVYYDIYVVFLGRAYTYEEIQKDEVAMLTYGDLDDIRRILIHNRRYLIRNRQLLRSY